MSKHTVIDFLSRNESHLNFNLTFMKGLESLNDEVSLIANKTHIDKFETKHKICFKDSSNWAKRSINGFIKLLSHRSSKITILATDSYLVPLLLILFFPFFRKSSITIILHNNISPLSASAKKRIPFKLVTKLLSIKLICLTQDGYQEVQKMGFEKEALLITHFNFRHIAKATSSTIKLNNDKTNILLIGRQAELFISKILPQLDLTNYSNLHFIVCSPKSIENQYNNLQLIPKRLSENEFNSYLKLTSFVLFPNYNTQFRASGILLDCISNRCPIIAPKEGHFKEYFEDNIGLFYTNIKELKNTLESINDKQLKRSDFPNDNFETALEKSSFESFKKKLSGYYSI